jgi:hypothetical protein
MGKNDTLPVSCSMLTYMRQELVKRCYRKLKLVFIYFLFYFNIYSLKIT